MGKRKRNANSSSQEMPESSKNLSLRSEPIESGESEDIKKAVELGSYKSELYDKTHRAIIASPSDLEQLDRAMGRLSHQLEQMLTRFQWLADVDIASILEGKLTPRGDINRYRVFLASHLIQQYWNESLPLFDTILSPRHNSPFRSLNTISGDLSVERLDALQAYMITCAEDSITALKQRVRGDDEFFQRSTATIDKLRLYDGNRGKQDAKRKEHDYNPMRGSSASPWPPKLPEISDAQLLRQVFTHKSAIVDASLSSEAELLHTHNERLEFKGDSILDFVICDLLYNAFPDDAEGSLSIKKASLVCNDTLFDLSVQYKLHERLNISKDLHSRIFTSKSGRVPDASVKNKALADVFEAYIAGVALNKGLAVVQDWLVELYTPLVNELRAIKASGDTDKNAKNELYSKVGSMTQPISYVTLNDESPFMVACVIGHEEVSRGTDRTVKLAGLRAAEAVLRDTAMVEKFAAERRKTPKTAPDTGF